MQNYIVLHINYTSNNSAASASLVSVYTNMQLQINLVLIYFISGNIILVTTMLIYDDIILIESAEQAIKATIPWSKHQ